MSATKVGIVYATGSKLVRRIIVPDDDKELNLPSHVSPGETLIVEDRAGLIDGPTAPNLDRFNDKVLERTGVRPPGGRCAVVDDKGNVVNVIVADPIVDVIKGFTLIASDEANPGWTWTKDGGFIASTEEPGVEVPDAPVEAPIE